MLVGFFILMGAPTGGAQEARQQEPAAVQDTQQQEDVIGLEAFRVVGSRVAGRSAQDSPVPVDVIQGEDLQTYGIRDMDSLLSATVPSYNVSQEPISDEATFVRPATLRSLPPNSTLVLVNGKRRHRGSVINFLGSPNSRGSQGADISTIPSIALERVEVLRDGAAAQIWGAPEVQYDYKFFGNLGLDLKEINSRLYAFGNYAERKVEGGFYFRNPHTRGGVFRGDPLEDGTRTVKVIDLSDDGMSGNCRDIPIRGDVPQFGEVNNGSDCFSFIERFPGGFTPRFGGYVQDWSIAFGLTGDLEGLEGAYSLLNGWFYDVSAYFGENSIDYFMLNTINPQLADMRTAIPTAYRPGGVTQSEKL